MYISYRKFYRKLSKVFACMEVYQGENCSLTCPYPLTGDNAK